MANLGCGPNLFRGARVSKSHNFLGFYSMCRYTYPAPEWWGTTPPLTVAPPIHLPQERGGYSTISCGVCVMSDRNDVRTFGGWWGLWICEIW
jgi:hypothetical protein